MGRRKRPRFRMVLPVNVWGTDTAGEAFHQLVYTMDISTGGGRLAGITADLKVGDVIAVRYKQAKARFQVAWVSGDQLGIQYLENEKFIWLELPAEELFVDVALVSKTKVVPTEENKGSQRDNAACRAQAESANPNEEIAATLESCLEALRNLDELVRSSAFAAYVGQGFHSAIGHLRNTAWAVQQGVELQQEGKDSSRIGESVNSERVRYVAQLCRELASQQDLGPGVSQENGDELVHAVQTLAGHVGIGSLVPVPEQGPSPLLPVQDPGVLLADLDREIRSSALPLETAMELILERLCSVTCADGAAIGLRDEEDMVCCASAGMAPLVGVRFSGSEGLAGETIATRAAVVCSDIENDPRIDKLLCRRVGLRSTAIAPIAAGESVLGVLQVFSGKANCFNADCLSMLQGVGDLVASLQPDPASLNLNPH